MKIEKLPSGSYRVRKTYNKKTYSIVFDHKPTEKEILLELSNKVDTLLEGEHITFEIAANEYCKLKKNVISPTTYREYVNTPKRLSETFNSLYIDEITANDIQFEINKLAGSKSPKTVRNYHGFIVAVMGLYRPSFAIKTTLPQKKKPNTYVPTNDEVKKLLDYSKTACKGRYYIPLTLACYGMRRSEICALTVDDFEGNYAHINKAKVMDSDKNWIIKDTTKTEDSTRSILVSDEIVNMIREQGYVYQGHPNDITDFIDSACKVLKIKHFSIHKLRHYFCTRLSAENIDTETIMKLGGWKTDDVLKKYRHSEDEKLKEASDKLVTILF